MNQVKKGSERSFISTYQTLGFIERDSMVILKPGKIPEILVRGKDGVFAEQIMEKPQNLPVVKDAISWYQSASYSFKHGGMLQ